MNSSPHQPSLQSLSKSFEPATIEAHWGSEWERRGYGVAGFRATGQAQADASSFCVQLPPPNVTGTLHMGHAFNQTIIDSLTRYHRMLGHNTLWLPGTDHAGIATQIVVERQLQARGILRHEMGANTEQARQNFVAEVWKWKEQSGNTITQQMRRMGASVDWSREYFTMDEKLSRIVTETFVRLYRQGLIYRGKRLVNWDPVLMSAVSDLEVESVETDGQMHYICYPFADGPQQIDGSLQVGMTIATTRPETMLADGALAVHPDDPRYRHLIGKMVDLPLCDRRIPIIADDFVDREFGSGCVKITGAHDFNDYACAQRHQLPLITIFTLDAKINEQGPLAYRGLDRFAARKAVLQDLKLQQRLIDSKAHKMMQPVCSRTGQVVEPMLTDQWFVAMSQVSPQDPSGKSIAQKAIDAVATGQVRFFPQNWVNTYDQWLSNIQDWCISRQLWWGHQIPAWYDSSGQVYVARTQAEAQAQAPGKTLTRDPDVLDTWYSAALVPFSTLGWPDTADCGPTHDYRLYLPGSVLVTGYDIIFFWVARMIMMSTHFTGQVPFRDVYIHGLVRDAQGKKMSKSEGNVLDPVDLIEGIELDPLLEKRSQGLRRPELAGQVRDSTRKEFPDGIPAYGADALRLTFASLASLGRSVSFDSKRCEGYRNFCNKLWNATRFVLMHCEGHDCGLSEHSKSDCAVGGPFHNYLIFSSADRWIVSQLQRTEASVAHSFAEYRLDLVTQSIYDLIWNEFCDWYLEIAKVQLQTGDPAQQRATRRTLIRSLETVLRLAHPVIPFITEALWQLVAPLAGRAGPSIMITPYPISQPGRIDEHAEADMRRFKQLVDACRNLRSELRLPPGQRVPLLALASGKAEAQWLHGHGSTLQSLARISAIQMCPDESTWQHETQQAAVAVIDGIRLSLKTEIDLAAERARLTKEVARVQAEIDKAQSKLANPAFVAKAPPAVLEQEQKRCIDFSDTLQKLQQQLSRLTQTGKD